MPRLVLLNGAPGIGKTTLARRYAADRPLALCLDVDEVRGLLGGWADRPTEAGLAARALALAMARVHLAAGHDVVVPQYVGRPPFAGQLAAVAAETGAAFHEVCLTDDPAATLARHAARGPDPAAGPDVVAEMDERLRAFVRDRPGVVLLPTRAGAVDAAYRDLLAALGLRPTAPSGS